MGYSSHFSLLPLEGGGAERRRLAKLSFDFGQPPALRASPFHRKGGMGYSSRFSLLPLEGGGAQRRRLASLSFPFGQPPALRASPFHGKGVDGLLIPLLPPSSGRRWRVAPEVGFALFRLRPTPALRASPFHGKVVDGLLTHSSTLHYPFTENGFQILATFIELKMNLKIGQSHYF